MRDEYELVEPGQMRSNNYDCTNGYQARYDYRLK